MFREKPAQPPALVGFESVARYWDSHRGLWAAKIGPGEYYVTLAGEMIVTVLGSCVAACVRDPIRGIGGMNHFMLPGDPDSAPKAPTSSHNRYGCYAMESLLNTILKRGGERSRLEIKLFGGGRVLSRMTDVGERNIAFVRSFVTAEGLRLVSEDLGGNFPRKVYFSPRTGKVRLKKLRDLHNRTIEEREASYARDLEAKPASGDVELFD